MKIKRTLTGAGNHVIKLSHYGDVGYSFFASASVTVKPLADHEVITSTIDDTGITGVRGTAGTPADALLVITGGNTDITVIQYGD